MRMALAVLTALHGLIHLLGPAKAFGWADVSQLRAPISPAAGFLWLAAAPLFIAAATGIVLSAPWWWYPALPGVLLSQGLIVTAWGDAKYGTLANVIIAILLLVAYSGHGDQPVRPHGYQQSERSDAGQFLIT